MAVKKIPAGFKLRHLFKGHKGIITRVAWSPDGKIIASPARDSTINLWNVATGAQQGSFQRARDGHTVWYSGVAWSPDGGIIAASSSDKVVELWDVKKGNMYWALDGHTGHINCVAWSPNSSRIATAANDETIRLWDAETTELHGVLTNHNGRVLAVAWSPEGAQLASGGADHTIRIWHERLGLMVMGQVLEGHTSAITDIAWSTDGALLASASLDTTVRIWDTQTGRQKYILEGHSEAVMSVSFSANNELLASKSKDGTVRLWRCDLWESVTILDEQIFLDDFSSAVFHPETMILATLGEANTIIRIWELDLPYLLDGAPPADTVYYTNAKVILIGDTGVGKSGLGLVLTGSPFSATESTHGRHVRTMDIEKIKFEDGREETREILLWDLAGQPGYRLVHQLHLNEVALALIIFDSRSEVDPFAGVRHWARALRQAQRIQGELALPMKIFLVAARVDRGGLSVSEARIQSITTKLGFDAFFETSAKEGWEVPRLVRAIKQSIPWDVLPRVSSNQLIQMIKDFLINEKRKGRVLTTFENLYNIFKEQHGDKIRFAIVDKELDFESMLRIQFETCIGRIESRDLIKRLSFGNLILLQPELLDAYASAIVMAAKSEPEGLGSIYEEDVRLGRFRMSADERMADPAQESLLLIATVEDLLRHEIALREPTDGGPILVFPSEFTRRRGEVPDPEGKAVYFTFEGALLNIYATLAVRLLRSVIFVKDKMWHNLVTFHDAVGEKCGMVLQELEEGKGKLTLFFSPEASMQTRRQFEEYIRLHLQRRAHTDTIYRHVIFSCHSCGFVAPDQMIRLRRERGFDWAHCPVCVAHISLVDQAEKIESTLPVLSEMDKAADEKRDLALADSIFQGKIATADFDVLLCYNKLDADVISRIATKLKDHGILPWLIDEERLSNKSHIIQVKAVAFFVGKRGSGPGQPRLLMRFLSQIKLSRCIVVPLLLKGGPQEPSPPRQLTSLNWIDFRQPTPDPIEALVNVITDGRGRTSHRQVSVWIDTSHTATQPHRIVDLKQLQRGITKSFDEQQLRTICLDLRIRYDDLYQSANGGGDVVPELIAYCHRRSQIHSLIAQCREQSATFRW